MGGAGIGRVVPINQKALAVTFPVLSGAAGGAALEADSTGHVARTAPCLRERQLNKRVMKQVNSRLLGCCASLNAGSPVSCPREEQRLRIPRDAPRLTSFGELRTRGPRWEGGQE